MSEEEVSPKILIAFFIILITVGLYGSFRSSRFDKSVEGIVVAMEYHSGPWEHTIVHFVTHSESSIHFSFKGSFQGDTNVDIGWWVQITYRQQFIHMHHEVKGVKVFSMAGFD